MLINKTEKKHKYIFALSLLLIVLLVTAVLWIRYKEETRVIRAFRESGGEIVVILKQPMEKDALFETTFSLTDTAEVLKQQEDYVLLRALELSSFKRTLNELKVNSMIKAVQINGTISSMNITNDTYSDTQWALNNTGRYDKYYSSYMKEIKSTIDIDMNIPEAWSYMSEQALGRREVIIAIIDTGIDYQHPELAQNIWVNKDEIPGDGLDNDNNGYVDDYYGWDFYNSDSTVCHYSYDERNKIKISDPKDNDDHGTHIAGIIGASANNSMGIAGVASNFNVKLMVLKINGGEDGSGKISSAVEAIKYATMMGADICNLSWGTYQESPALKEVIEGSDMLFIAAAGNLSNNNDKIPVYPASLGLSNVISVTFVDADGKMTGDSNYGSKSVDIAAPGKDILSTVVGSYSTMGGSSMAAPYVSAVAAMIYSYNDYLFPANVKELLLKNVKQLPGLTGKIIVPGIPDAYQLVTSAIAGLHQDKEAPIMEFSMTYDKGIIRVPIKVKEEGGSGVRVIKWLSGIRSLSDFRRGTIGTSVEDQLANLDRAGTYTFYASDYAGNESYAIYVAKDDETPPKITANYTVSSTYASRTVSIKVTDSQSSVKRVKYMSGKKSIEDFLPAGAGNELTLIDNKASFKVKKDGTYTIFSIDYRGNATVKRINIKTIKSKEIKLDKDSLVMLVGEKYQLKTYLKPINTTDRISYRSSNQSIASVTSKGRIQGHKPGTVTITAETSSGVKVTCKITVKKT